MEEKKRAKKWSQNHEPLNHFNVVSSSILRQQTEFGIAFIPIFGKKAQPHCENHAYTVATDLHFMQIPEFPFLSLLVCKSKCLCFYVAMHIVTTTDLVKTISPHFDLFMEIKFLCFFSLVHLLFFRWRFRSFQKQTFIHNLPCRYSAGRSGVYYSHNIL